MEEAEIDYTDYLPKTTKDIGELWRTLTEYVASFQNPHLKSLVELFMEDREIAERYRNAPAARRCITLTSVDCWITWCRCFAPAI